jgi:hypothetical protein
MFHHLYMTVYHYFKCNFKIKYISNIESVRGIYTLVTNLRESKVLWCRYYRKVRGLCQFRREMYVFHFLKLIKLKKNISELEIYVHSYTNTVLLKILIATMMPYRFYDFVSVSSIYRKPIRNFWRTNLDCYYKACSEGSWSYWGNQQEDISVRKTWFR